MIKIRDCLDEMVKFTLDYCVEFDIGLTGEFCSGLLCGESVLHDGERIESSSYALLHRFSGVPDYPLYKVLALGLLKSIDSGSFCGTFEKISLGKEVIRLKEKEDEWSKLINQKGSELVNALKDVFSELQVQEPLFSLMKDGIKTVEARCFEEEYDRIRRGGSMVMINKCLMFEVLELHQYASFYELLKAESSEKVFPGTKTVEEGMQMFRKLYDTDQENFNGVVAIHLSKSVAQPCVALAHILSGLSYTGVQNLLGLSHTTGSIFHALPPPRSMLLSSFMLPYKPKVPQKLRYSSRDIVVNLLGNG
ncbi:RNA-binding ASCH domain protein [Arabidopsis thaliana]|uniref:RNA-binding ASCH domain protein n=1 Tax=Arabidopsis thaliana TaxID=3702 RepID=A0A1P8B1G3_ARATH|nr:RNA-binding ASCH domain protein [Arabidopsis thaliana]ANM62737.1 RNA-binding ASCH domain protein [Arabidopsis thaliana]|eukprot:NP_001324872.1 RNA-binding ASCH domain protein [Arabidopsis thaliana]